MLKKALLAIAAPKHQAATGQGAPLGDRVAAPLRMGQAFAEYIENYPTDQLPNAGGVAATVVVTIDLDVDLSASEARRLACEAGILPVVLGGKSQPLDVGRRTRFHTTAQRIALGLRDKGCTAVGCDWPPACVTPTTTNPGTKAAAPASKTAASSAPATTPTPTTPPTR